MLRLILKINHLVGAKNTSDNQSSHSLMSFKVARKNILDVFCPYAFVHIRWFKKKIPKRRKSQKNWTIWKYSKLNLVSKNENSICKVVQIQVVLYSFVDSTPLIQNKAHCPEIRNHKVCVISSKHISYHSLDFIWFCTERFFELVQVV